MVSSSVILHLYTTLSSAFKLENSNLMNVERLTTPVVLDKTLLSLNLLNLFE